MKADKYNEIRTEMERKVRKHILFCHIDECALALFGQFYI